MTSFLRANRPELAILRGKFTDKNIDEWVTSFAGGKRDLADRYLVVLSLFIPGGQARPETERFSYLGQLSPNTRKAYTYAIVEFSEFIARVRRKVVPPHEVTRADAEEYVEWLANRDFTLEAERLKDGDQEERLQIYETVKELASAKSHEIGRKLPRSLIRAHPDAERPSQIAMGWLNAELGRMVLKDLLVREPTLEEIRRRHPRAGIDQFTIDGALLWDLFTYKLPQPKPVGQTTIALRLEALSAFWEALAEGDAGGKPIVTQNPWKAIKKRASHGIARERKRAAEKQRIDPGLIVRMLDREVGPSLVERRNAALIWFLVLTGVRVSEAIQIRRGKPIPSEERKWSGWLDTTTEPPMVVITRKGGARAELPYPTPALQALVEFHGEMRRSLPPPGAHTRAGEKGFVDPDSPRWRYKLLLEEADAPLFPPIQFWGANSTANYQPMKPNVRKTFGGTDYRVGLTRHGVVALLRRYAQKAGLTDEEIAQIHPHGLRHFAATAMASEGKDLREVQAILGHESITTTEKYLAEPESREALTGTREIMNYLARIRSARGAEPPVATEPRPEEPKRAVIDVLGTPVEPVSKVPGAPEPGPPPPAPVEIQAALEGESLPAHMFPEPPVVFGPGAQVGEVGGRLYAVGGEPEPVQAREIRDGISPGSPWWVYDAQVTTREEEQLGKVEQQELIHWSRTPQDRWLKKYYPLTPNRYGLGDSSLLAWFAKGQAHADGQVTIGVEDPETGELKQVEVAPIPLLSPIQAYPEATIAPGQDLLSKLEALEKLYLIGDASRGIAPSPTRYFGLHRWFAFMSYATLNLQVETRGKYKWVPFDAPAVVSEEVRAHADSYILEWYEKNAHTYKTAYRYFKQLVKREPVDFWDQIEPAAHEAVALAEPVPDWFADPDPVHSIYEHDPAEYAQFERWLANLTGQRLSKQRQADRDEQLEYADEDLELRIQQARDKLESYYLTLQALEGEKGEAGELIPPGKREKKIYEATLKVIVQQLVDEFGIPDPYTIKGLPKEHEKRVEAIVQMVFRKDEPEQTDANVFKSQLFSPEHLRIDTRAKTIKHTDEFREKFAENFEGRDSECVMRRAARAMWEHARRKGPFASKAKQRGSQYAALQAVMLSYMAWIFPCPHDIEERIAQRLRKKVTEADRRAYFVRMTRNVRLRLIERLLERVKDEERRQYLLDMAQTIRDEESDESPLDQLTDEDIRRIALMKEAGFFDETPPEILIAEELGEESPYRVRAMPSRGEQERKEFKERAAEVEAERVVERDPKGRRLIRYNANARAQTMRYLANAMDVMPSPLRMIAAMTIKSQGF